CPLTSIVIDFSGFLYGRSDAWRAIGTPGRMIFFVQVTVCGPARQVFAHRYMGAPQPHCLKSGWFSLMTATEPGHAHSLTYCGFALTSQSSLLTASYHGFFLNGQSVMTPGFTVQPPGEDAPAAGRAMANAATPTSSANRIARLIN